MINEKEKEGENFTSINNFDARVVHTVRNLKKLPSRHSDENNSSGSINTTRKRDSGITSSNKNLAKSVNERVLLPLSSKDKNSTNNLINLNERISIDGSGQSTSDSIKPEEKNHKLTSKTMKQPVSNKNNTFKYSYSSNVTGINPGSSNSNLNNLNNKFAPMKTKTEFQKRLMSENNIIKYKSMCIGLLKEDEEIKKMCEFCFGINMSSTSSMFGNFNQILENFIEENLFLDKFFLYKLETLLNSDVSKQNKEKFFKQEIKKAFDIKVIDVQYENKLKGLNFTIDSHIQNIQNFEFFN